MNLMLGDCLERMKEIPDGSVDMVLTDPPYGTTACKWDSIIPLVAMWEQLKRVIKPNGAIVMTASQPFTSVLITSYMEGFRYAWVWDKRYPANYPQAKRQPMKRHEDVVVFGKNSPVYLPQMIERDKPIYKGKNGGASVFNKGLEREDFKGKEYTHQYPVSIQLFPTRQEGKSLHPTQKPVALMEYLIKTYTLENETVLDFTMGSGSTGVACKNLNRKFIGIEKDEKYFQIAKDRIENHKTTGEQN
jgi:site-specific DNA-methyltransferase (adenine-specific)